LGVITLSGLACAALVNASPRWAAAMVSLTVLALLTTTAGAVFLSSRARAFCGGFAIFGWAYLLLAGIPLLQIEPYLLTGAANDRLFTALNIPSTSTVSSVAYAGGPYATSPVINVTSVIPAPAAPAPSDPFGAVTGYGYAAQYYAVQTNSLDYASFDRIGHALWMVLLGLVGGFIASGFARRRQDTNQAVA
jgi:hypothetical protein